MLFTTKLYPGLRQIEIDLLNAFPQDIIETDLQELRSIINTVLGSRANQDVNKAWAVDEWTIKKAEQLLQIKTQISNK